MEFKTHFHQVSIKMFFFLALNKMMHYFLNNFYFLDFDQDGVADNISFMIKRIKVHTSEAAKDPHYRFPGNYGVEKFLELFSGKYHHVMFKYFSVEKFFGLFPGKYCSVMFKRYFSQKLSRTFFM
jgi:hypothetical protein